jgi:hypothetical protein
MGGHERRIHLTVARIACLRCEGCDITLVAIVTLEWLPRYRLTVGIQ